ncbi:hypothetical protein HU200_065433 [Digitaria exilis]|uniref:C2 domain-containing protein n=1 Tax=Digitaria exilis TaxID=1010633 RepID=A0A834ZYA1_9POAL|nr:hypothetical protein HU200_065433 [Digitaria exilis]
MAYRELELTLLSAHGLKNVNLLTRMEVYAVVTISGNPLTRQCTAPDISGGRNPIWNATLRFAVPPTAEAAAGASLHVLLRAERVLGDRDVGEVIVPLADLLAAAPVGPHQQQQPQVASYQVRKVHRWEPRGVLNVSYRLGPVVAPVAAFSAPEKKPPTPVIMAYPVEVPASQPPFRSPADASYSPRRSGAVRAAAEYEEKKTMTPAAPSPAAARNGNGKSNGGGGLGRDGEGPTQVCVGPHTQIILNAGSNAASPRQNPDGARPMKQHDDHYYSPAHSTMISSSPRRKEDRPRPNMLSQHDTQEQVHYQQAVSSRSREQQPASSFSSSRSSSSSSSSAYPFAPSPHSSSAHSSAPSPYSSPHPNNTPSPRPLGNKPAVGDAFGSNKTIGHTNSSRSVSGNRAAAASSPLSSSSPLVANHHSGMVPSR